MNKIFPFTVKRSDSFNFFSHLVGSVSMLLGFLILIYNSGGSTLNIVLSSIYSTCAIFTFVSSAIYHLQKRGEDINNLWRKLDHIAIFFMIAGTYTPLSYIYLDNYWRWGIIGAQWLLVFLGLFFTIFYIQGPRWLTTATYVLMGWMALIPLSQLIRTMPFDSLLLLFAGGISYSVGALIYAIKKPNPLPGIFGFHEIFHLFILLGALLHYFVVYGAIAGSAKLL